MKRQADYYAREAKRMRKSKKIRAIYENYDEYKELKPGKKKRKSSFTSHLTSLRREAVQGFRHGFIFHFVFFRTKIL